MAKMTIKAKQDKFIAGHVEFILALAHDHGKNGPSYVAITECETCKDTLEAALKSAIRYGRRVAK
jgi:hypothetical protein